MESASSIGELALARQLRAQRLAAHVRQYIEEDAVRAARVDEREDVRVIELRRDAHLLEEPVGADDGGEIGAEHLERDVAIVLEIAREVDGRHSSGAELATDPIASGHQLRQSAWRLSEQRREAFYGAAREQSIGTLAVREQRLELRAQRGVARARAIEERRPVGGLALERRVEQRRELLPAVGKELSAHARAPRRALLTQRARGGAASAP